MTPEDFPTSDSSHDGETADLLRSVLAAEAADVQPDPQALETIRARVASDPAGCGGGASLGLGTGRRPWLLGTLGAAAATAAIIGGAMYVGHSTSDTSHQPGSFPAAAGGTTSTRARTSSPSPTPTAAGGHHSGSQPTPPTLAPPSSSAPHRRASIMIKAPANGATVGNPVAVRGSANVFEANVNWQLLNSHGQVVKQGHTMAGFMQWKPFTVRLGKLKPGRYTIRAFEASPRNGKPTHLDSRTFAVR